MYVNIYCCHNSSLRQHSPSQFRDTKIHKVHYSKEFTTNSRCISLLALTKTKINIWFQNHDNYFELLMGF